MEFDYFYGEQSDMYSFYRIPKLLFTDKQFSDMSTDSKLLYGILLDRMSLSAKNQWFDKEGRVYIIFTIEELRSELGYGDKKVTRLLDELEKGQSLIERKRQGLGKPNLIYVKNFFSGPSKQRFLNRQNNDSGFVKTTIAESSKEQSNNTNSNYTEESNTYPIVSTETDRLENDWNGKYTQYRSYFYEQLEMDLLYRKHPYDTEFLENILELILETICTNRKIIRIAGDDKPAAVVRGRLLKLDANHIEYVLDCFKENTTKIKNIKQYLLAAIFNAPVTMDSYYSARVQHDLKDSYWGR